MDAPNRVLLHDLVDTGVVAGNAMADVVEPALTDFVRGLRIRDELAGHPD
jgi:hypothetical protein